MPTNAELLQDTYEAFGRGDIPAVLAVLDEDIVWNAPDVLPHAIPVAGRDDAAKFFQSIASTDYGFVHAWTLRDGVCVRFDEYVDPTQLTVA